MMLPDSRNARLQRRAMIIVVRSRGSSEYLVNTAIVTSKTYHGAH